MTLYLRSGNVIVLRCWEWENHRVNSVLKTVRWSTYPRMTLSISSADIEAITVEEDGFYTEDEIDEMSPSRHKKPLQNRTFSWKTEEAWENWTRNEDLA